MYLAQHKADTGEQSRVGINESHLLFSEMAQMIGVKGHGIWLQLILKWFSREVGHLHVSVHTI